MQVLEVLEKGLENYRDHGGAKGTGYNHATKEVCAMAAVQEAIQCQRYDPSSSLPMPCPTEDMKEVERMMLLALYGSKGITAGSIPFYNDLPEVSKEDIEDLFEATIQFCKSAACEMVGV